MARIPPQLSLSAAEHVYFFGRGQMGAKYAGGPHLDSTAEPLSTERVRYPMTAAGRSARWVVFQPDRLITWDNHKLP